MLTSDNLNRLAIPVEKKTRRRSGPVIMILIAGGVLLGTIGAYRLSRRTDSQSIASTTISSVASNPAPAPALPPKSGDAVLTVSGYIIPRARIEISPRFQGTVKWIGVKKGDRVKKGDVLVRLEDDEYLARHAEASGRQALAEANLFNAETNLTRI